MIEAQSWSFIDHDFFYEDHMFDAYGELNQCVIANVNTLLDIPSNTGSYHDHLILTVALIELSPKIWTVIPSGLSLLGIWIFH